MLSTLSPAVALGSHRFCHSPQEKSDVYSHGLYLICGAHLDTPRFMSISSLFLIAHNTLLLSFYIQYSKLYM